MNIVIERKSLATNLFKFIWVLLGLIGFAPWQTRSAFTPFQSFIGFCLPFPKPHLSCFGLSLSCLFHPWPSSDLEQAVLDFWKWSFQKSYEWSLVRMSQMRAVMHQVVGLDWLGWCWRAKGWSLPKPVQKSGFAVILERFAKRQHSQYLIFRRLQTE